MIHTERIDLMERIWSKERGAEEKKRAERISDLHRAHPVGHVDGEEGEAGWETGQVV